MSKISDLVFRYLHRQNGASGNTPTQYTASAGSANTVTAAALSEADDYWIGALLRWDSGPNVGRFSTVGDFDAASDTLTLDRSLPNAASSGHTFTLFQGGRFATNQRVPGMTAGALSNVTGFSLEYVAMLNGEGSATLSFVHNGGSGQALTWTPPGGLVGVEVDISGLADGESAVVLGGGTSDEDRSKFVIVTRTAAALPGADASDVLSLDTPDGTFLGPFTGEEASSGTTIYRPVAIENAGAETVFSVRAYCDDPEPTAADTTIAASGAVGTGAGTLTATSLANWPATGWVYNSTKGDLRYYFDRSGNTLQTQDPSGGIRGFTAVAWDDGDSIELYPWMDIGVDEPTGADEFEDPSGESVAPTGVTFSAPQDAASALLIGDMAAGDVVAIWERFVIPAGLLPVEAGRADLRVTAEVTS